MSMRDVAWKVLDQTCAEIDAKKSRRSDIEKARALLVNAGVHEDILKMVDDELDDAKVEVRDLLIQRFIMRAGMRSHGWLADGE